MKPTSYNRPVTLLDRALLDHFPYRVLPVYAPMLEIVRLAEAAQKPITAPEVARLMGVKDTRPIYWTRRLCAVGLLETGPILHGRRRAKVRGRSIHLTPKAKTLLASHPYTA